MSVCVCVCVCVCVWLLYVLSAFTLSSTIAPPLQALTSFSLFTQAAPILASFSPFMSHIVIVYMCITSSNFTELINCEAL